MRQPPDLITRFPNPDVRSLSVGTFFGMSRVTVSNCLGFSERLPVFAPAPRCTVQRRQLKRGDKQETIHEATKHRLEVGTWDSSPWFCLPLFVPPGRSATTAVRTEKSLRAETPLRTETAASERTSSSGAWQGTTCYLYRLGLSKMSSDSAHKG